MTEKSVLAWHFVGETLRDGQPIPDDGVWLEHTEPLRICESGLHASRRLIDALSYAPGSTICRVRLEGIGEEERDKLVCKRRKILWRIDGEKILGAFARSQALSVIHLWDAPGVVKDYLETGDETLRSAARSAASSAAWPAEYAARSAEYAAWSAAWYAADVAWSAARSAARSAAWYAAKAGAENTDLTRRVFEARREL